MLELIATIILISSLFGVVVILLRKIPILVTLPSIPKKSSKEEFILKAKNQIQNIPFLKSFSFEIFLQKILSKIRILTLRIENKTESWLQQLRARTQKRKIQENDNYWEGLKNTTIRENKKLKKH